MSIQENISCSSPTNEFSHNISHSVNPGECAPSSPTYSVISGPPQCPRDPLSTHPSPTPLSRLAIHTLILHNFKSYGGTVHVGPFHKNFSAIVGPNGSGKSNVIDAMLFIFGRPAKQLRHSKLSELLHNSATFPDIQSATVTVNFHDIIDTGPGDEDFTALPNSEFSVARTAYRNNTSKYFVNDREVKRQEVVALLKSKGVDLDNNRFLILQGEVEQISLMKPKSVSAHDTGLLEYLEDIIGSNRHIEKINQTSTLIENMDEERSHKLQRVKAAERERDALENAKNEAQDFLDKERRMLNAKLTLNTAKKYDAHASLTSHKKQNEEAAAKVEEFRADVTEKEKSVIELETIFKETQKHEGMAVKDLNEAKESYAAFERKDIKLREDLKALKAKDKKLDGIIHRETEREKENVHKAEQYHDEAKDAKELLQSAELALSQTQQNFDKIRDDIKQETLPIRERLEQKQAELLPFSESVNAARKNVQILQANLTLLDEKLTAPQRNYDEAVSSLEAISLDLNRSDQSLKGLMGEHNSEKKNHIELSNEIAVKIDRVDRLSSSLSDKRRRLEEARSSREFSSTRSRLHTEILSASRSGRLQGIVGRLGDLASVGEQFATAVSAGAGSTLDCIVVRTAQHAQACIQFLRTENLGRATFVILDKIEYLRDPMDRWARSDRSQDGRRLFDYLKIPNPQNRTALYYALRDTLVCQSLEDARRVAYKPTRKNRVVTVAGELIESTGSITGGGRAPTKYRLGSGHGDECEMSDETFRQVGDDVEKIKNEIREERSLVEHLESKRTESRRREEELEILISKAHAEISSIQSRKESLEQDSIPNLKKCLEDSKRRVRNNTCEDSAKRRDAETALKQSEQKLKDAKAACEGLERDISKLQGEILAAGGGRLEGAKSELDLCRNKVSQIQNEVSTASSRASASEKAAKKAGEAVVTAMNERKELEAKLATLREQSEAMLDSAEEVARRIKEAETVHEEWAEKLKEVQADYSEVKGSLKSLRRKEVSLMEAANSVRRLVEQDTHYLASLNKEEKDIKKKIEKIAMHDLTTNEEEGKEIDSSQDDEASAMEGLAASPEQVETESVPSGIDSVENGESMSPGEQKKLEAEIARFESELASMSPNLNAISEYASKDREYLGQVGDLDDVTRRRDEARRECDRLKKTRLDEFMHGFSIITLKLKELYQMITLGGDAELELVDSLDPFSEGVVFSVRPPKKSWKNIRNLSGGEKTLSSLALVFALHHYKPTPLYFLDEIDAALDFKNVSIVGNYVKERTRDAQFIIISLRNNMFELADRLVGIYKTHHTTKSVTVNPKAFVMPALTATQVTQATGATEMDVRSLNG